MLTAFLSRDEGGRGAYWRGGSLLEHNCIFIEENGERKSERALILSFFFLPLQKQLGRRKDLQYNLKLRKLEPFY